MKAMTGLVMAGVVAGATALALGCIGSAGAKAPASPPAAAPAGGKLSPAEPGRSSEQSPVNPCRGMQEREEVFEFARKPTVTKVGEKYIVAFASKARCDATVAVIDEKGRVVRHLASGVLGGNAPRPFIQGSLSQSLEWDGRDDKGKPALPGCQVRVSLGLKPGLDRVFGWSAPVNEVLGMAVDSRGELYVLGAPNERGGLYDTVRVFDRQGKYLRTIMPHAATVAPERMTLIEWTRTTRGEPAIDRPRSGTSRVFDRYRFPGFRGFIPQQSPVVTADGSLAIITEPQSHARIVQERGRKVLFLDARDGAAPPGSILAADTQAQPEGGYWGKLGVLGHGRIFMTVSADRKWLYLGAGESSSRMAERAVELHAVSRISLEKRGPAEKFIGEYETPGTDNARFNRPRGVACDREGNLYVCDQGNDRIQVFKPDGSFLRTLALEKPDQIAVHPETGALYVLRAVPAGGELKAEVVKLAGSADPTVRARLELPVCKGRTTTPYTIALDGASTPPALWVASDRLWRVEDRGDRLEKAFSVQERNPAPEGWENWQGGRQQPYIAADPLREELYVREHGGITYGSPVLRVDGRTGRVIERLMEPIENVCPSPNGLVYMRLTRYHGHKWLARYDPDARKYLAFPGGVVPGGVSFPLGPGFHRAHRKEDWKPAVIPTGLENFPLGPYLTFGGGWRSYADQTEVAPNGDIYVLHGPSLEHLGELEKAGLRRPTDKTAGASRLLQVYSPEGERKVLSALPGLWAGPCGLEVRVGPSGAVYLGAMYHPAGQTVPEGIAPDGNYHPEFWGTLIKFRNASDGFPAGNIRGAWGDGLGEDAPTHYAGVRKSIGKGTPIRVENMHWQYGGLAPRPHGGCTCEHSSFDVDLFERVFLPAVQTASVNVLDANGNLILRMGRYGNADSGGRGSPVPEPDIAFIFPRFVTATDEAVYVDDEENARILRIRLAYAVQETVGL